MPESCSRCGLPIDENSKCAICGVPLCPYEIRILEGYGLLCQRCYQDLSYEYRSKSCDVNR